MIFEIGKFYRHSTGKQIAVLGELETTLYGKTLIAETDSSHFISVGRDETSSENFHEISKDDWMKNFSK